MSRIKQQLAAFLAVLFIGCFCVNAVPVSASEISASAEPAIGTFGTHSMSKIGSTRNHDHTLWKHWVSYGSYTTNYRLYAYCMSYGYKASNIRGTGLRVINWPYSNSKKQILSYAASYVVNHKDKYNYFAMQGISWATIGMSKVGGRWYRDTSHPLITMGYNDDLEYTTQEPIFSPEADEFVANLIIQDDGNKNITEDNGDICPTCGGYGYLWQYYQYSYWGYYNEYDSDSGSSTDGPYTFTQKQNDEGFIEDNTDEYSYYGYDYGSWGGHYPINIQKIDCTNPNCDLENYWDGDYSGATVEENNSEATWKAYCEMKYYIHLMSQVPSYASKSETTAKKEENIIHLKWNGTRYEANISDTNCVTAQHQLGDGDEESTSDSDDYGYYFTDGNGYHFTYIKGWTTIWYNGSSDPNAPCDIEAYKDDVAQKVTVFSTICSAMKEKTGNVAYWNNVTSSQWQDFMTIYEEYKPTIAYLAITVDSPYLCDVGCSSENNIKIYDLDGNEVDYIIPGEKYKLRYTFSYSGGSKGYGLKREDGYAKDIDYYRVVDRYGAAAYTNYYSNYSTYVGIWYLPYMKKLTDVTLNGKYSVFNMPYDGKVFTWDSDSTRNNDGSHYDTDWNIKLYIDAFDLENTITSCIENNESWRYWKDGSNYQVEQYRTDKGYEAWRVVSKHAVTERANSTATEELDQAYYMQVERINADDENPEIKITWQYETPYQVFKAPLCDAESEIHVPESENSTKYFPGKRYNIDMNGRFYQNYGGIVREMNGSNYTKRYYDMECTVTKNAAYKTSSLYCKQWKLITDIKVTQFHASSGDGITSPVDILNRKYLNYQFYYGIRLTNDEATIRDYFYRTYSAKQDGEVRTFIKDTNRDSYKGDKIDVDTSKDLNTYTQKKLTGLDDEVEIQTDVSTQLRVDGLPYINLDHIHTGTTLIQRTLPVVVATNQAGRRNFSISVNVDDEKYENRDDGFRSFYETEFDTNSKENNDAKDTDPIVKAINPANENERPTSVFRMDNINAPVSVSNRTAYRIRLNGNYIQVYDTFGLGYDDKNYNFDEYNRTNGSYAKTNAGGEPIKYADRSFRDAPYYKYSSTNFRTLRRNSWVTSNEDKSNYKQDNQEAVESYRISKVLFRSNYTDKYMKTPDVTETDETGHNVTNWVDLSEDQNRSFRDKKARVAAGQGFELKVQVTYTNNNLIEYLDKTVDKYAAAKHSSTTMSSKLSYIGKQYANHFYGTIYDGSQTAIGELQDLAGNQVEIYGSNIYEDLYASISNNEETAYSYSGIDETMQIWNMDKDVNCDYANNRITIVYTYTLKESKSNGLFGRFQKMKFYTDQLAPDSKAGDAESKKHYINLWTAVFPALEIDDDLETNAWNFDTETRYLGDVTKLEYLISSTAADDSIVHIVQ